MARKDREALWNCFWPKDTPPGTMVVPMDPSCSSDDLPRITMTGDPAPDGLVWVSITAPKRRKPLP